MRNVSEDYPWPINLFFVTSIEDGKCLQNIPYRCMVNAIKTPNPIENHHLIVQGDE